MRMVSRLKSLWAWARHFPGKLVSALKKIAANRRLRQSLPIALLMGLILLFLWGGLYKVREGEVGVIVNNLTGNFTVENRVGYVVLMPFVSSFHRLDRRVQSLTMAQTRTQGFGGGDAVKIKTSDGSNVALDMQVTYRIIAEAAADILQHSGPGFAFRDLWIRSSARSAVLEHFGQLTTEQIYNAALRTERAQAVVESINQDLNRYGIEIVSVVPQDIHFFKEYEEIIKQKKLADQEVEEQQAQARLAVEEQQKQTTEANFSAQMKIATAEGNADRIRAQADGYVQKKKLDAEAALATVLNQAEGVLAVGLAEAEGLRQAALAVSGRGGINLVALEYAKQLGKIKFNGVPVVQEGRVGQYRIHQAPQATSKAYFGGGSCQDGSCPGGQ